MRRDSMRRHRPVLVGLAVVAALAVLPTAPAAGQSLPDPARAVAVVRCQQGIVTAGGRLVARRLRMLEACAARALGCVQARPADPKCLIRVADRCRSTLETFESRDLPTFGVTLERRCGGLDFADVLAADGLGYAGTATQCLADEGIAVVDPSTLARCLATQHMAAADRLFAARLPRGGELLATLGVTLVPESAVPNFGGSGAGLGDPRGAGKRVLRCSTAIQSAGDRLVASQLRAVERCARAVHACVQTATAAAPVGKAEKLAPTDCLPLAAATCDGHRARTAAQAAALRVAIEKRCGPGTIAFDVLREPVAANLAALSDVCAGYGVATLGTLDDYVECLGRQQVCESERLVVRQVPRARELAAYAGRSVGEGSCIGGTDALALVQSLTHTAGGSNGLDGPRAVAVSPDGAHVYVASFDDDSIAVFSRNAESGALSPVEVLFDGVDGVDGVNGPRGLALSPDGTHVYVAGARDDAVAVFARDPDTGTLAFVQRKKNGAAVLDSLNGARGVVVSPDGTHVYVVADPADAIAVFARAPATGMLEFVEREKQGEGGVAGLDGPYAVTVSPDGASVYVTAFDEDAVSVFARDASTGALAFVEREKQGEGGAAGLDGARAVAVAPDGAYVYVAGELSRAVAILARDPSTGALTPSAVRRHVYGAVDGLARPGAVAVSADGSRLFTASGFDNVVAAFARDAVSGGLVLTSSRALGIGPASGEPGVLALALAPDAAHAYVVQSTRDVLEVVSVDAP